MDKIKRMLEILDETAAYYSEDTSRRSVEDYRCRYNGPDGKRCAFSRCVRPELVSTLQEGKTCSRFMVDDSLDHLLQEQYKGFEPEFWDRIQHLHDSVGNWGINELSELGKENVRIVKYYINQGRYIPKEQEEYEIHKSTKTQDIPTGSI